MKRIELRDVPASNALYALTTEKGLLKIGCSGNVRHRMQGLYDHLGRQGDKMDSLFVVCMPDFVWNYEAERHYIKDVHSYLTPLPNKREWFPMAPDLRLVMESAARAADTALAEATKRVKRRAKATA